jgi:hypothetical protein
MLVCTSGRVNHVLVHSIEIDIPLIPLRHFNSILAAIHNNGKDQS